jgi:hypothetical protein
LRIRELLQTNNGFNDYVVGAVCSGSSGNSENPRESAVAASVLRSLIGCMARHRPAQSSNFPGLDNGASRQLCHAPLEIVYITAK